MELDDSYLEATAKTLAFLEKNQRALAAITAKEALLATSRDPECGCAIHADDTLVTALPKPASAVDHPRPEAVDASNDTVEVPDVNLYAVDPAWDLQPGEYRNLLDQLADGNDPDLIGALFVVNFIVGLVGALLGAAVGAAAGSDMHHTATSGAIMGLLVLGVPFTLATVATISKGRKLRAKYPINKSLPPLPYAVLSPADRVTFDALANKAHVQDPEERHHALVSLYEFTAHAIDHPTAHPVPYADTPATTASPSPSTPSTNVDVALWAQARNRFTRVRDAWTDLVVDPLNVLDHAALLDVTIPTTAAFVDIYGQLTDLAAVLGDEMPTDPTRRDQFINLARDAERCWTEALRYADRAGIGWLPPVEQAHARKARSLLATAADDAIPLPERALAAKRAADLLAKITSIALPEPAVGFLDGLQRKALTAAPTAAPTPDVR